MRVGIVACDILKHEIEALTAGDEDIVHREYLEFALHVYPEEMREKVMEAVNRLEGKVDAVLIGYATCQSLGSLDKMVRVPSVMLEGDDCISVLMGPRPYAEAKAECTGTWFSSPGWAQQGMDAVIKELHLDSMVEEGYSPEFFLGIIFDAYKRCLFIDTGVGDKDELVRMSLDFAQQLKLPHTCTVGTLDNIGAALLRVKHLAREAAAGGHQNG